MLSRSNRVLRLLLSFAVTAFAGAAAIAGELQAPIQVTAGGKPIDVEYEGHSAPFYGDVDEDGVNDLLVGQFREGRLRIYRNLGTNAEPRFEDFVWFRDGAEDGRVPEG